MNSMPSPSSSSLRLASRSIDQISGNISPTVKQAFLDPGMIFPTLDHDGKYRVLGFAMETIFQRVVVTDINSLDVRGGWDNCLEPQPDVESFKSERATNNGGSNGKLIAARQLESVRLVCEVDVLPDMANNHFILHGGCTSFLIDMCSSLTVVALIMTMKSKSSDSTGIADFPPKLEMLSQSMNAVYHSPSPIGDRLRIVCTTMPMRELNSNVCVRTEMWSKSHHRLVASGVQTMLKMSTSASRL